LDLLGTCEVCLSTGDVLLGSYAMSENLLHHHRLAIAQSFLNLIGY